MNYKEKQEYNSVCLYNIHTIKFIVEFRNHRVLTFLQNKFGIICAHEAFVFCKSISQSDLCCSTLILIKKPSAESCFDLYGYLERKKVV